MSTLQLSEEMIRDIQDVIQHHDKTVKDIGSSIQYLSAITGLLVARYPGSNEQRLNILRQLNEFSEHVLKDNLPADAQIPKGQEAFGVWRPEEA